MAVKNCDNLNILTINDNLVDMIINNKPTLDQLRIEIDPENISSILESNQIINNNNNSIVNNQINDIKNTINKDMNIIMEINENPDVNIVKEVTTPSLKEVDINNVTYNNVNEPVLSINNLNNIINELQDNDDIINETEPRDEELEEELKENNEVINNFILDNKAEGDIYTEIINNESVNNELSMNKMDNIDNIDKNNNNLNNQNDILRRSYRDTFREARFSKGLIIFFFSIMTFLWYFNHKRK